MKSKQFIPEHICIRKPAYVTGNSVKPEIGVFIESKPDRKPFPWNNLNAGETVWMKWSGDDIVAKASISGYRQILNCTPAILRNVLAEFSKNTLTAYINSLKPSFHSIIIYLTDEQWLNTPISTSTRSYGCTWITLRDKEQKELWFNSQQIVTPRIVDPRGPRTATGKLRRDNFTCQYCNKSQKDGAKLHVDHVIPYSKGGKTIMENLKTACIDCNLGKSASLI